MRAERPRHRERNISRGELKRDKAFQAELARAWGVEQTPRSYRRALERTYERLPQELIVHDRPLRTLARGLGGLAGACAALCLLLFVVNFTAPQFTENLPGVGPAFQAFNQYLQERFPPKVTEPAPPKESPEPPAESKAPVDGFQSLPVEDQEIVLEEFSLRGGEMTALVRAPYMGRTSYSVIGWQETVLLGSCATLTFEDGSVYETTATAANYDDHGTLTELGLRSASVVLPTDPMDLEYVFSREGALPTGGTAVLTLYESGWWSLYGGSPDMEYPGKRVIAEFTLDLSTGQARPSAEYQKEGLARITPEECLEAQWAPAFTDEGWMAGEVTVVSVSQCNRDFPGTYDSYFKVEVFRDMARGGGDAGLCTLDCYWKDDLVLSAPAAVVESVSGETFLDEDIRGNYDVWYKGNSEGTEYYWYKCVTDESLTGRPVERIVFAIPAVTYNIADGVENAQALFNTQDGLHFSLVGESGETLLFYMDQDSLHQQVRQMTRAWSDLAAPQSPGVSSASPSPAGTPGVVSANEDEATESAVPPLAE